jgi:hypothetical protein
VYRQGRTFEDAEREDVSVVVVVGVIACEMLGAESGAKTRVGSGISVAFAQGSWAALTQGSSSELRWAREGTLGRVSRMEETRRVNLSRRRDSLSLRDRVHLRGIDARRAVPAMRMTGAMAAPVSVANSRPAKLEVLQISWNGVSACKQKRVGYPRLLKRGGSGDRDVASVPYLPLELYRLDLR